MKLSQKQITQYNENGYIFINDLFEREEVKNILHESTLLCTKGSDDVIWESNNTSIRAIMGCHLRSSFFQNLVSSSRFLEPTHDLLKDQVYAFQLKINVKPAFNGDMWPWHQDFIYWYKLDGMPNCDCLNFAIFLDHCSEFNGPLWLIPKSHKDGMLDSRENRQSDDNWSQDLAADLSFTLADDVVSDLVEKGGIVSPKGSLGSALIFHPNLAHASLPNISPYQRRVLIVTYNSVSNVPTQGIASRPDFLVNRDTRPLQISNDPIV